MAILRLLVVGIACLGLMGASKSVGRWTVTGNPAFSVASTTSGSGAELGILCMGESAECLYYFLNTNTTCKQDIVIPMLASSTSGAYHVSAVCRILTSDTETLHTMVLTPFDTAETIVSGTGQVGLAIPMESGQFNVFRFDMNGAAAAIQAAKDEANNWRGDQSL